jgi:hypothetical protein
MSARGLSGRSSLKEPRRASGLLAATRQARVQALYVNTLVLYDR